jgi:hypothetical protein
LPPGPHVKCLHAAANMYFVVHGNLQAFTARSARRYASGAAAKAAMWLCETRSLPCGIRWSGLEKAVTGTAKPEYE